MAPRTGHRDFRSSQHLVKDIQKVRRAIPDPNNNPEFPLTVSRGGVLYGRFGDPRVVEEEEMQRTGSFRLLYKGDRTYHEHHHEHHHYHHNLPQGSSLLQDLEFHYNLYQSGSMGRGGLQTGSRTSASNGFGTFFETPLRLGGHGRLRLSPKALDRGDRNRAAYLEAHYFVMTKLLIGYHYEFIAYHIRDTYYRIKTSHRVPFSEATSYELQFLEFGWGMLQAMFRWGHFNGLPTLREWRGIVDARHERAAWMGRMQAKFGAIDLLDQLWGDVTKGLYSDHLESDELMELDAVRKEHQLARKREGRANEELLRSHVNKFSFEDAPTEQRPALELRSNRSIANANSLSRGTRTQNDPSRGNGSLRSQSISQSTTDGQPPVRPREPRSELSMDDIELQQYRQRFLLLGMNDSGPATATTGGRSSRHLNARDSTSTNPSHGRLSRSTPRGMPGEYPASLTASVQSASTIRRMPGVRPEPVLGTTGSRSTVRRMPGGYPESQAESSVRGSGATDIRRLDRTRGWVYNTRG